MIMFVALNNKSLPKRGLFTMYKGKISLLDEQIFFFNPIALRKAKTLWSFGLSGCNRFKS